jgi:hypothetical protein
MRYGFPLFLLMMLAGPPALPQSNTTSSAPTSKTTTSKTATKKLQTTSTKAAPKTASAAPGTRPSNSKKTVASKKGKSTKSAKQPAVAAATYRQMAPTPDRYREIQQALIDKGYLKSDPNGVWDAQSQDALRQFQTDQKLSPTGKLSAASLIALGLGPKTGADSVSPQPAGVDSPPPATVEIPPPAPPPAPTN